MSITAMCIACFVFLLVLIFLRVPIAIDQLQQAIDDLPAERKSTLVLKADEKASFGIIVKVMDALKLAGVKNLPAFTQSKTP